MEKGYLLPTNIAMVEHGHSIYRVEKRTRKGG